MMFPADKLLAPLHSLRRVLPLLWVSTPTWTIISALLILAEVAFSLAALYLTKHLIDALTGADPTGDIQALLLAVILVGAFTLAHLATRAFATLADEIQGQIVADHMDNRIHAKAVAADLAFYESPRYFDTLQRARQAGNTRPARVIGNLLQLTKNAVMLLAIGGLITAIHWLLLPVLLLAVIPGLLVRLYFTRVLYEWQRRRTQLERQAAYIDWLMTSDFHAKELRLNQLGDHLREQYTALRALIRRERLRISQRRTLTELVMSATGTLAFFASLAYLVLEAAQGRTTVGNLVLFLLVFQRAQGLVQALLANVSQFYEDHLYLGQLFEFLDIQPVIADPATPAPIPRPMAQGIRLEQVSFQYPGAPDWALRDLSLRIAPGQVVALVGANGSGKTSLIKVLCRLYDPSEGRITLDGADVRQFRVDDYRRVFSVIFQDYAHYAMTVRDNIRFGDIRLPADAPAIERAAVNAGADTFIRQLRHGYETRLSKMFDDGQDLSIGQWQKIALARAFLHQSQVVVLDEPTSALDANAEFELFQNFRERIGHRAAVVISHRLSTVRLADYIYVLDQGRIVEHGTHDALISQNGVYQRLFERQAFHYR
ncbi:MAG: ABC transporter ATP-binding protein [Candidatus Competibacteraceae bacterium]|nr:MAG: ABC transporter ATP-binding protein [Candidatus Competibacteraceae bacterium]